MKKPKYRLAKLNGMNQVMTGSEIALLQQSGASCKPMNGAQICIACGNKTYLHGECYHCGFDATEVDIY